jgi:hypothetical protein
MWSSSIKCVAMVGLALVVGSAAPQVDVLTVETRQAVVTNTLNLEFYNAYASSGVIQRCILSDVRGALLLDFTPEVDKQRRGRQDVPLNVSGYASGTYYAVVTCAYETITLPFAVVR